MATMPQQAGQFPGQQMGPFTWDGTQWVCGSCFPDGGNFPFCPPPGFPPFGCPPWFSGHNSPPWYPGANAGVSFGTAGNFPPNPVRGHFFWDGVNLWMFDGAVWVAVGGQGGGPDQHQQEPQFSLVTAVDQPLAGDHWQVITPSVAPFDVQGGWDSLQHRWTPRVKGVYLFIANCFVISVSGAAALAIGMNDNGTQDNLGVPVGMQEQATGTGVAGGWLNCTGGVTMNGTTDFVRFFAFSSGTGGKVASGSRISAFFL